MTPEQPTSGDLRFTIDARHVRQLGRELVADRVTAVSELIKNAYDADATEVRVCFSASARAGPRGALTISDNGTGMTLADVTQRWMVISTDFKSTADVSDWYRRTRAGQKGIGRFAAETLGGRLVLSSTVRGHAERVVVRFDWLNSYLAGKPLEQVRNPYEIETAPSDEHGTTLRIEDLHDLWDQAALKRVNDSVFLLQPPFRLAEIEGPPAGTVGADPGFRASVGYDDEESAGASGGDLEDLAAATAWVEGEIATDGTASRKLESRHLGIDESETLDTKLLLTGPFRFRVAYFVFRRDALNPESSVSVRRAQQLAERFGGIRLYRDGLRILPYGEQDDDWLGLDAVYRRRGQVLAPIGNQNFFGEVHIAREDNVLLVDTASREGVVENEAFKELSTYLRGSLVWAVNRVAAVRRRKVSTSRRAEPPSSRQNLLGPLLAKVEEVAGATSAAHRDRALSQLLTLAQDAIAEARRSDRQDQTEREELLDELSLLRVLATLGGSVAVFGHEVSAVLTQAQGAIGDLIDELDDAGTNQAPGLAAVERNLGALGDLAAYLDLYVSQGRRRRREPQPLHEVLTNFASTFRPLIVRRGVNIETDIHPVHLRTPPMSRSELEAVLSNFLSNSLKALDVEGKEPRKIRIEAQRDYGQIVIRFLDSGTGIEPSIRERVFDPFFTTTEASDSDLGMGTGLGLKIVADIVTSYGGSVAIEPAQSPFVTCMVVRLPGRSDLGIHDASDEEEEGRP
jgi:signal transduction histidine kinase